MPALLGEVRAAAGTAPAATKPAHVTALEKGRDPQRGALANYIQTWDKPNPKRLTTSSTSRMHPLYGMIGNQKERAIVCPQPFG